MATNEKDQDKQKRLFGALLGEKFTAWYYAKLYVLYLLLFCVAYLAVFRPGRLGQLLGTWFHDLFGTFWHYAAMPVG